MSNKNNCQSKVKHIVMVIIAIIALAGFVAATVLDCRSQLDFDGMILSFRIVDWRWAVLGYVSLGVLIADIFFIGLKW